ncbi:MAG TPA: N-acetyltransferase [Epsilonproteobacteria bacterium]|nr:N-acetyltransferase [Campylobacterota bacterium]
MHPEATPIKKELLRTTQKSCKLLDENQNPKSITTRYDHRTKNNNKLDLYIDIDKVGFVDYKIKDEQLKKIAINQISIDAYYQKNGLGTYLIECLKKEFNTITLLSISKSLNLFYEKNNFEEDLSKTKQRNTTNYVWTG